MTRHLLALLCLAAARPPTVAASTASLQTDVSLRQECKGDGKCHHSYG